MAGTLRNWLMATAATAGVVGGGAAGLTLASEGQAAGSPPTAPVVPAARPNVTAVAALQTQVQQLAAEDRALKNALSRARGRLASEVSASEQSLLAVRQQLAAARGAASAARVARASSSTAAAYAQSGAAPATHTTTGASGSTSTGGEADDSHESGADD